MGDDSLILFNSSAAFARNLLFYLELEKLKQFGE